MMMQQSNELVHVPDLTVAEQVAKVAIDAGIVPAGMKPTTIQAIVAAGLEMGLQPFHALRSLYFIQGRLVMSVQAQLALARRAGVKIVELKDEANSCTVTLARDTEKVTCTYTIEDARRAGLLEKTNSNWAKYPRQMLRWRAIGDALRIIAADVLLGVYDTNEFTDIDPTGGTPESTTSAQEQASDLVENADITSPANTDETESLAEPPAKHAKAAKPAKPAKPTKPAKDNGSPQDNDEITLAEMERHAKNALLKRLHSVARSRFKSDSQRRTWLQQNFSKSSFLELSRSQAEEALYLMQLEA